MDKLQQHQMTLEMTYPEGVEEWHCPTCGRRLLVQWEPIFKKIVVEPGNEEASHSGATSGATLEILHVEQDVEMDEAHVLAWENWLQDVDLSALDPM